MEVMVRVGVPFQVRRSSKGFGHKTVSLFSACIHYFSQVQQQQFGCAAGPSIEDIRAIRLYLMMGTPMRYTLPRRLEDAPGDGYTRTRAVRIAGRRRYRIRTLRTLAGSELTPNLLSHVGKKKIDFTGSFEMAKNDV